MYLFSGIVLLKICMEPLTDTCNSLGNTSNLPMLPHRQVFGT